MIKNTKNKLKIENIIILLTTPPLTLFRIMLMSKLPLWALGNAGGDDALMVRYTELIYTFNWLKPMTYTSSSLVKGMSFPFFVSLCNWLSIPYMLGLALFYVFSSAITIFAVKPIIKNKNILLLLYLFLLYSPAGFTLNVVQRFYRQSVIFPTVLTIFASLLAIWIRKNDGIKSIFPWSMLLSIMLIFFWYIREDSIWVLPFLFVSIAFLIVHSFMYYKTTIYILIKRILLFALPLIMLISSNLTISKLNYYHYGTKYINDRTQGNFAKFCSNIMIIDSETEENNPVVWVYKAALDKFAAVSPVFNEMEKMMYTYDAYLKDGEFKGDLYHWAIRKAANDIGYYKNAYETEAFFEELNNELLQAFDDGRIKKNDKIFISNQAKGIRLNEIPKYIILSIKNGFSLICYNNMRADITHPSTGTDEQIRKIEAMTGSIATRADKYNYDITGTVKVNNENDNIDMYLYNNNEGQIVDKIKLEKKNGEYIYNNRYTHNNKNDSFALQIYVNDKLFATVNDNSFENNVLSCTRKENTTITQDISKKFTIVPVSISNSISNVYSFMSIPLFVLSIIGFIALLFASIKGIKTHNYKMWNIFIYVVGIILTIILLIIANSIFNEFLIYVDNGSNNRFIFYTVSAVPLIQMAQFFSIYFGMKCIKNKFC